jgi:hypothetical protein
VNNYIARDKRAPGASTGCCAHGRTEDAPLAEGSSYPRTTRHTTPVTSTITGSTTISIRLITRN